MTGYSVFVITENEIYVGEDGERDRPSSIRHAFITDDFYMPKIRIQIIVMLKN